MTFHVTAEKLDVIAWQVRRWLDWHKAHRDKEHLVTDGDTHIMGLPVPFWPSHGQFEEWIKAFNEASAELRLDGESTEGSKK